MRVAGLDGYTSDATGAAYTTPNRRPRSAPGRGSWCRRRSSRCRPGEPRDVDFTLHVPPNDAPGEYLGAVGLWVPLQSSSTTVPGGNHAGFAVTLQGERVIAVEVVVPGPRTRASR